jgi:hypothetical protein
VSHAAAAKLAHIRVRTSTVRSPLYEHYYHVYILTHAILYVACSVTFSVQIARERLCAVVMQVTLTCLAVF